MSDYISREDAKNYVIGRYDDQLGFITMEDIIDQLDYVPAADVRPVVRGTWQQRHYEGGFLDGTNVDKCSACGWERVIENTTFKVGFRFCPSCGADMREEDDRG